MIPQGTRVRSLPGRLSHPWDKREGAARRDRARRTPGYRIDQGQSGGVEAVHKSRRLGTPRVIIQIIPTPEGRLRSISTRRQQAAVGGGQTEMGPQPVGMGGVMAGAQFAEQI